MIGLGFVDLQLYTQSRTVSMNQTVIFFVILGHDSFTQSVFPSQIAYLLMRCVFFEVPMHTATPLTSTSTLYWSL